MTITPEELEAIRARHEAAETARGRSGWCLTYGVQAVNDRATLLPLAERCLKAEARCAELEEALKPFGELGLAFGPKHDLTGSVWDATPDYTELQVGATPNHVWKIKVGDLRRAASLVTFDEHAAKTLKDT